MRRTSFGLGLHRSALWRSLFRTSSTRLGAIGEDRGQNFKMFVEIDGATQQRIANIQEMFRLDKAGVENDWIAGEKVHGANFGLYIIDGETIRWGKRTGFIPENDFFYGYHAITPRLQVQVRAGYRLMCEKLKVSKLETFLINGEIFGGKYLHPLVPRSKQRTMVQGSEKVVSPVQKDDFPQYTPDLDFFAYDVKYRIQKDDPFLMLDHDDRIELLSKIDGLMFERPILRGPLDKILALDLESFQTTLPGLLGLSAHYLRNNKAEGIVIRHAKRGSIEAEKSRLEKQQALGNSGPTVASANQYSNVNLPTIIKLKCHEFEEMYNRANIDDPLFQLRDAALKSVGSQLPLFTAVFPTIKEQANCRLLMDHIVNPRLNNVISKCGEDAIINNEITQEKLAFMLAEDAIKDFIKELPDTSDANIGLILRREMCRYVLFEAKRLVAKQWPQITAVVAEGQEGKADE